MKVNGACHCGGIRYEAEVDPQRVTLCNCTDCQMLTGTAYRVSVQAPSAGFRLLSGKPKRYLKTAESGAKRAHYFCPDCGSPVYATADSDSPEVYTLRAGGIAQKDQLPPTRQIWCRSALPWSRDVRAIPGVERQ
jgi:hypothetical protein